jgi:hypothetical protein
MKVTHFTSTVRIDADIGEACFLVNALITARDQFLDDARVNQECDDTETANVFRKQAATCAQLAEEIQP